MIQTLLAALAAMAENSILVSNNTICIFMSYQPKAPANIKDFQK